MLICIEGGLGSGKTIMLVRYLYKDYLKNKNIIANLKLNNMKYSSINFKDLLANNETLEFNNSTIGIDEITVFIDCRTSISKRNKIFSYFVLQSRKRDVNVYFTTQDIGMLDFRVVDHTEIIILCEKIYNENNNELAHYRKYTIIDLRNKRKPHLTTFIMNISKYYHLYDTNQIIEPSF